MEEEIENIAKILHEAGVGQCDCWACALLEACDYGKECVQAKGLLIEVMERLASVNESTMTASEKAAYLEGFMASGEGCNGEYPYAGDYQDAWGDIGKHATISDDARCAVAENCIKQTEPTDNAD